MSNGDNRLTPVQVLLLVLTLVLAIVLAGIVILIPSIP